MANGTPVEEEIAVTDFTEPAKAPVYKVGNQVLTAWGQSVKDLAEEELEDVGDVHNPDASPYEAWRKPELVQEIKNRNEGRTREDHLSAEGTAAELRERLEDDDAVEE